MRHAEMKGIRQFSTYTVIGMGQFALDTGLYALILWLTGFPLLSNVASRGLAAMAGFWLNSRFSFRDRGSASWRRRAIRYTLLWGLMTIVSSGLIGFLGSRMGTEMRELYVAIKVGVEIFLFLVTFTVMRVWVFQGARGEPASRHEK